MAARVQHQVDGPAAVEVWLGGESNEFACIYDAEFVTLCGAVTLSDAGYEEKLPVEIGEGPHRLRILVDRVEAPEHVAFEFDAPDA